MPNDSSRPKLHSLTMSVFFCCLEFTGYIKDVVVHSSLIILAAIRVIVTAISVCRRRRRRHDRWLVDWRRWLVVVVMVTGSFRATTRFSGRASGRATRATDTTLNLARHSQAAQLHRPKHAVPIKERRRHHRVKGQAAVAVAEPGVKVLVVVLRRRVRRAARIAQTRLAHLIDAE
jgi:hypothetical protein